MNYLNVINLFPRSSDEAWKTTNWESEMFFVECLTGRVLGSRSLDRIYSESPSSMSFKAVVMESINEKA